MLRVLILCQRKSSKLDQRDSENVNTTVDYINTYMGANFGEDVDIEYLTTHEDHSDSRMDNSNYVADYKIKLSATNPDAIKFVAEHTGAYDGIILNTCMFNYMNYEMISKLLKVGGFILLKTFAPDDEDGETNLQETDISHQTLNNLSQYFTRKKNDNYGSHYYIKERDTAGKKTKRKTRRKIKRKKIKRRKIKRTTKKRSSHYD